MNASGLWWVVLLCGLGTFFLRLWPMRWHQGRGDEAMQPWLRGALQALGPAAIGALLVASLWSQWRWGQPAWPLMRVVLSLLAIVLARRVAGGVALPTLAGILAYGGLSYALA